MKGVTLQDLWTDVFAVNAMAVEREDYPTQKPEALLQRLILLSSNVGDIVLDGFIGSGTTAAVAQKLGRRWIGCDINNGAIQTTSKRLQTIINEQMEATKNKPLTLALSPEGERDNEKVQPAQSAFTIWRVNDYETIVVEIEDFISPTIIERLSQQAGLLKPKIDDWRAMVDCVMIDTTYDGKVFNVALSDVPEKKTDFVQGRYELPALIGATTVAVKIVDMLGEEALFIKAV
jgi:DNA methylase